MITVKIIVIKVCKVYNKLKYKLTRMEEIKMFKKKAKVTPITIPVPVNATLLMAKASSMVDNALSMFSKAVKDIESANQLLEDSKKMSEEEIAKLKVNLEVKENDKIKAEDSIKANNALKEKLSQFVV